MAGSVTYEYIGVVEEGLDPSRKGTLRSKLDHVGTILIYPAYREALEGLGEYSHILVISHLHLARRRLVQDASRHGGPPRIGALATRYPGRPNPIGLTLVELLSLAEGRLRVRGLDLYTRTPILDIKPYDHYDIVCNPRVPQWMYNLWREKLNVYLEYGWPGPIDCPRHP